MPSVLTHKASPSPEIDNAAPSMPHTTSSSTEATPVPVPRNAPETIFNAPVPFLARSTSPGRPSAAAMPPPSISTIGSIGVSSVGGIQQTLTPATTANFSGFQRDISPIGSQGSSKRPKSHPSDWNVEEVVDWLRSKGFDQSICDIFIGKLSYHSRYH
jgi:hypothetical protein